MNAIKEFLKPNKHKIILTLAIAYILWMLFVSPLILIPYFAACAEERYGQPLTICFYPSAIARLIISYPLACLVYFIFRNIQPRKQV